MIGDAGPAAFPPWSVMYASARCAFAERRIIAVDG